MLYLTDHPIVKNGGGICTLPIEHSANPLNLTAGHEGITARHAPLVSSGGDFSELSSSDISAESDFSELYSMQNSVYDSLKSGLASFPDQLRRDLRHRREVEKIIRPQTVKSANGEKELKTVTFDCDRGTAKCIRIR